MRSLSAMTSLILGLALPGWAQAGTPLQPFVPDAHTLLLYHFDEGAGTVLHDSSGHGYDAEIRGPRWAPSASSWETSRRLPTCWKEVRSRSTQHPGGATGHAGSSTLWARGAKCRP